MLMGHPWARFSFPTLHPHWAYVGGAVHSLFSYSYPQIFERCIALNP